MLWQELLSQREKKQIKLLEILDKQQSTYQVLAEKLGFHPKTVKVLIAGIAEKFPELELIHENKTCWLKNTFAVDSVINQIIEESECFQLLSTAIKNQQPAPLKNRKHYLQINRINNFLHQMDIYLQPKNLQLIGNEFHIRQLVLAMGKEFLPHFSEKADCFQIEESQQKPVCNIQQLIQVRNEATGTVCFPIEELKSIFGFSPTDSYWIPHSADLSSAENIYLSIFYLTEISYIESDLHLHTHSLATNWLQKIRSVFPEIPFSAEKSLKSLIIRELAKLIIYPNDFLCSFSKLEQQNHLPRTSQRLKKVKQVIQRNSFLQTYSEERLLLATLEIVSNFISLIELEVPYYLLIDNSFSFRERRKIEQLLSFSLMDTYHLVFLATPVHSMEKMDVILAKRVPGRNFSNKNVIVLSPEEITEDYLVKTVNNLLENLKKSKKTL